MGWWDKNNFRMLQFNLEARDAGMDVDRFIEQCKEFHINVLMVGTGGMIAYYPSKLESEYVSPYLGQGDMLGKIIQKCHENDIRVIGRFDFSKIHESIADRHPDWLFRSSEGEIVNFNQMVNCCLSAEFMREKSLDILREVVTLYDIDGIFFNMFGYRWQSHDYSGKDYGLCQCDNCKQMFKERYGHDLPKYSTDPNQDELAEFETVNTNYVLDGIFDVVKNAKRDILISTYKEHKIDVVRNESNTKLGIPHWIYSASDNCMTIEHSYPGKTMANCAINAVEIYWRFMGVANEQNMIRLYQNMACGSQLDYCIVGTFDNYPETENFAGVRKIFALHEKNEQYYGHMQSKAQIALVKPAGHIWHRNDLGEMDEYYGLFKALKEGHYNFDVLLENCLGNDDIRKDYKLVILPGLTVDPRLFSSQTSILATGKSYGDNPAWKNELFDATHVRTERENKGSYIITDDKTIFKRFPRRDWLLVDGDVHLHVFKNSCLEYLGQTIYAPVEMINGFEKSGFNLAGIKKSGQSTHILVPFGLGTLYHLYGYTDHRNVLLDLIDCIDGISPLATNAPDMVEVFYDGCPGGRMVQYINLTGFNGKSFFPPISLEDITITIPQEGARSVRNLVTDQPVPYTVQDGLMTITLDKLDDYASLLIE